MDSEHDTLIKLADKLGLAARSPEFERVWAHLQAEGWTPGEVARTLREAVAAGREHLKVIRTFEVAVTAAGKRKAVGGASWRQLSGALEHRAADFARQDEQVVAYRREVLAGRLVGATHAQVQTWLRGHAEQHSRLTVLADRLAIDHWWMPNDAIVFVLTDATPPRPSVRMQMRIAIGSVNPPRIVVEAESWVPPAQVARAFRNSRDRMQRSAGQSSPRRARALSPRAVALVAFVERTPGSWRERLAAWNTANPKARFKDRANFRRAYETAKRRLDLSPSFLGA